MKFLRNRKTGVVFPYHEKLAKNKNMDPCAKDGKSMFDEVEADIVAPAAVVQDQVPSGQSDLPGDDGESGGLSDNGIVIAKATKAELIQFAKDNYGVQLEDSQKVGELREQVQKLAEVE